MTAALQKLEQIALRQAAEVAARESVYEDFNAGLLPWLQPGDYNREVSIRKQMLLDA